MEAELRNYENPFPDFSAETANDVLDIEKNTISETFRESIEAKITAFLRRLEDNKHEWIIRTDSSVYTGNSGIAYLYYFCGTRFDDPSYLNRALELIERGEVKKIDKRAITFLTGEAGKMALGAVLYHKLNKEDKSAEMISRLKWLYDFAATANYDELLYGRAGYLFTLLFVNKHISDATIDALLIKKVINCIFTSGRDYAREGHLGTPLMYSWHDKEYVGGAHGLAGILYVLLQSRKYLNDDQLRRELKLSVDYLSSLRFESSNFPSSMGNKSDKLVHWCHGAPSMTMLFLLAFEVFNEQKYLRIAKDCGEVVWSRGLLKKGCGICHGVAGNAYTFLSLFQATKDLKYLYRACKFAEWCFDYDQHQNRTPDRPFSLFEGLSGVIYFLIDLLHPSEAKFPGYTL